MRFFKYFGGTILMILLSCNSAKQDNNADATSSQYGNSETIKMTEAGYVLGRIVASQAVDDCPFVIRLENRSSEVMLDPINLEDNYKEHGLMVWFKYTGLRKMNRCEKANPIQIKEISIKE